MSKTERPWEDWIPGVLSNTQLKIICEADFIRNVDTNSSVIDGSSIDLILSDEGYSMPKGAVKPFGGRFISKLTEHKLVKPIKAVDDGSFLLNPEKTYLFKLRERLQFPNNSLIYGEATAKSSVGRVDVLARLIVDGMDCYDYFNPEGLDAGIGELFIEITSLTFHVKVRKGCSLSQLRLFFGKPSSCQVTGKEAFRCFIQKDNDEKEDDGSLSVELSPILIGNNSVAAFRSKKPPKDAAPIPLWEEEPPICPDPCKYWSFIKADDMNRIKLEKGKFYIIRSKEKLKLHKGIAVNCQAIDETLGEMRIHYAGFAHPWFGRNRSDGKIGTPLIFEVRGHDVQTSLKDGDKMARLSFYRMSEDVKKPKTVPKKISPYENQTLQLSKFFSKWPDSVKVDDKGNVSPA